MDFTENIVNPLAWYIVFIISVTLHEAAHAWAAKRGGDLTAYTGGQVSLNPWPHMKRAPFGMVILPLISVFLIGWPFGFATTPYDAEWAARNPRKATLMGLAGPAANLLLLVVCGTIIYFGLTSGLFLPPDSVEFEHIIDPSGGQGTAALSLFIGMLFSVNLILLVLNLIPFPPLDGSNLITFFLNDSSARTYRTIINSWYFGVIGLLLAWWVLTPLFNLIFLPVVNLLYSGTPFYYQ
jgi:Zn-dependent protease